MKNIILSIISFIKADFEVFAYALKTDNFGYDLGDFLKYWRTRKNKRKMVRKITPVRSSVYAKR